MKHLSTWGKRLNLYRSVGTALVLALYLSLPGCSTISDRPQVVSPRSAEAPPAAAPSPTPIKETTLQAQPLQLQDLSVREEQGQSSLFVKLSKPVSEFRHFPLPQPARIVVDIFGDAKQLAQPEIFRMDTHWLSTLRVASITGALRLTFDVAAATAPTYTVTPEDGGIKIVVGPVAPDLTAKKALMLVQGGKRTDVIALQNAAAAAGQTKPSVAAGEQSLGQEKRYTGQKISLDFKDADIKNVFRLLAEVSGLNIVVTDDVTQKVTVRLTEVPWDQALDLIVKTNALDKEEVGNVIRISTAARLKADRDALAASKKSEELSEELQTAYLTVNYARVIKGKDEKEATDKDLIEKVKTVLSPRGKVEADQRTNTLIIRDIKRSIDEAQTLIAKLDVRTPQVLIESNLIETTPSFSRALGIQMETLFNKGRVQSSTRFGADEPFRDAVLTFFENTTPIFDPATGFAFGYFGNNIAALLSAAEAEGNVKIISRPSVVTLNNVESRIESTNTIRVRTQAAQVGEAGGIEPISAGIILTVTPQVSADGFVLLRIEVKSSTLDFSRTVDGIPQENIREAKANVLVRDGETVVIGGIMKDEGSTSTSGVPYLKDIPVLGWLFKKTSSQKEFQELVVFITPRIIEAGSKNLPTAEQLWRDQLKQTQGP